MTLSEPPPTLAIYQEKHKFSDSFKKLIAACLVKDPKKRPSAAALLKKDFFKKAVDKEYIKKHLCGSLPEIPMGALKTDFDSAVEMRACALLPPSCCRRRCCISSPCISSPVSSFLLPPLLLCGSCVLC